MLAHALSLLYSRRDCRNNGTRSRLRRTIAVPSRHSPLLTIPAGSTISQGMLAHALSLLYSRRDCRNNGTRSRLRRTIAVPSRHSPLLTIPAGSTTLTTRYCGLFFATVLSAVSKNWYKKSGRRERSVLLSVLHMQSRGSEI